MLWNPFKRATYTFATDLSPQECGKRIERAMSDYNGVSRANCLITSVSADMFTARLEPLLPKSRGDFARVFVVRAAASFAPARNSAGTTRVSLVVGFSPGVSLFQIAWRLVLVAWPLVWLLCYLDGIYVVGIGVFSFLILLPFVIPWSIVAYVQGMRQAHRDWTTLLDFTRSALHAR